MIRDTVLNAVRRLRSMRPDTPILLTDHPGFPHRLANPKVKEKHERTLQMQKQAYEMLLEEGVTGLYYLSNEEIAMPQDASVEGIHMSDYGMMAYADAYERKLREILHEPVGDLVTMIPVTQQRDPYIWMDRHYDIVTQSAGKHYSRVLIGDSIMHFWCDTKDGSAINGQASWDKFEGTSLNLGCGYDRIENVLWRIYHGQLDGFTADRIYLTIGTNNIKAQTFASRPDHRFHGKAQHRQKGKTNSCDHSAVIAGIPGKGNLSESRMRHLPGIPVQCGHLPLID
jgi:hypothetical protein